MIVAKNINSGREKITNMKKKIPKMPQIRKQKNNSERLKI